ncbi:TPA: hypothetical protein ACQZK0_005233 [Enterobacter mori]
MLPALSKYIGRAFFEPVNKPLSVTLQRTYRVAWEFWNTLPIPHVIAFLDFDDINFRTNECCFQGMELLKDVVYRCPNLYIVITNYVPPSGKKDDLKKLFPRIVQPRIIGATGPAFTGMAHGQIRVVRCDDSEYANWLKAYCSDEIKDNFPHPLHQPLGEVSPAVGLTNEHVLNITSRYHWLMKNWI